MCHAISGRRVTQINLIPEFHMQSRQHLLGQYNARAVADLDKFQRLVHTDVITLKGGVEELLNPSANPREPDIRSEEHTSELQSLMRISSAVFCSTKKHTPSTKRSSIHPLT